LSQPSQKTYTCEGRGAGEGKRLIRVVLGDEGDEIAVLFDFWTSKGGQGKGV